MSSIPAGTQKEINSAQARRVESYGKPAHKSANYFYFNLLEVLEEFAHISTRTEQRAGPFASTREFALSLLTIVCSVYFRRLCCATYAGTTNITTR
jgi:hypothetical protein